MKTIEGLFFYQFINFGSFLFRCLNFNVLYFYMRTESWITFHLILSFDYVTCVWANMYMWYANMTCEYFLSCFFEFPLLWNIFISILLPDWFPFWFDFYEVSGVENRFIMFHPDKVIKQR